jgi:hypothetical protein
LQNAIEVGLIAFSFTDPRAGRLNSHWSGTKGAHPRNASLSERLRGFFLRPDGVLSRPAIRGASSEPSSFVLFTWRRQLLAAAGDTQASGTTKRRFTF